MVTAIDTSSVCVQASGDLSSVQALHLDEYVLDVINGQVDALRFNIAFHDFLRLWIRKERLQEVTIQEPERRLRVGMPAGVCRRPESVDREKQAVSAVSVKMQTGTYWV